MTEQFSYETSARKQEVDALHGKESGEAAYQGMLWALGEAWRCKLPLGDHWKVVGAQENEREKARQEVRDVLAKTA